MKSETFLLLTPTQRAIAALAAEMAANNPDAAAELAKHLAHHAAEANAKRRTFGIGLRFNAVTGRMEMRAG